MLGLCMMPFDRSGRPLRVVYQLTTRNPSLVDHITPDRDLAALKPDQKPPSMN